MDLRRPHHRAPHPWYAITAAGFLEARELLRHRRQSRVWPRPRGHWHPAVGQDAHAPICGKPVDAVFDRRLQISFSGRRPDVPPAPPPQFVTAGVASNYDSVALTAPPRAPHRRRRDFLLPRPAGLKLRSTSSNSYRPRPCINATAPASTTTPSNAVVFSPYGDPRLAPDRYNSFDTSIDQYLLADELPL